MNRSNQNQQDEEERAEIIDQVSRFFKKLIGAKSGTCRLGLNVGFYTGEGTPYISFNLDHLGKEKVIDLLEEGKLYEEVMLLYRIAHLPYALWCYSMDISIGKNSFCIIDRASILLGEAFHPLDEEKLKNKEELRGLFHAARGDIWFRGKLENGISWLEQRRAGKSPDEIVLKKIPQY